MKDQYDILNEELGSTMLVRGDVTITGNVDATQIVIFTVIVLVFVVGIVTAIKNSK